jgi:hypothetical protein
MLASSKQYTENIELAPSDWRHSSASDVQIAQETAAIISDSLN